MAEEQDQSQKTEEPTHKRLEEAFKKGQVVNSREVSSFLMLITFTLIVLWMMPGIMQQTKTEMLPFIANIEQFDTDPGGLGRLLTHVLADTAMILVGPLFIAVLAALGASLIQHPFNFTVEPIIPKLEKISVTKGLKRMFSMRSLVEFLKGVIKISIVGIVATIAIMPEMGRLKQLPDTDTMILLVFIGDLTQRMLIGVCITMFFIAILDYLYQRYEFMKSMRMSKQEIKDEYKQQEGDPVVKQRLRSLRMERARQRMMAAVPNSDVVITNPTHFAVALEYDAMSMKAPKLVAKGADLIAFRIREIAKENDVPIVENPPLARALHDGVELDQEIPYAHYQAVAQVISYVYKLKGKVPLMRKPPPPPK